MRATGLLSAEVSQLLVLENLLTENFWRDADTNRWREPTPEEREKDETMTARYACSMRPRDSQMARCAVTQLTRNAATGLRCSSKR